MNKAEVEDLPEYVNTERPRLESEIPNSPIVAAQESVEDTNLNDSILPTSDSQLQNLQAELNDIIALDSVTPQVLEEEIIRLLGERLIVDRSKRKIGEVIVRKEIETRMVQIPVRREKLIVEQVSPEHKQLAEIDLGEEEVADIELPEEIATTDTEPTVRGVFNSPKVASLLLNAIALERRHGCKKVRVEIVVEDAERQKTYQEWVNRCSDNQPH